MDAGRFTKCFVQAVAARAAGMANVFCFFDGVHQDLVAKAMIAIYTDNFITAISNLSLKLTILQNFSCITAEEMVAISDFFNEEDLNSMRDDNSIAIMDAILNAANLENVAMELYTKTFQGDIDINMWRQSVSGREAPVHYGSEWKTNDPTIDGEHDNFYELLARFTAAVNTISDTTAISGIFDCIKAQIFEHARTEEDFARQADPEIAGILHEAHLELFAAVAEVSGAIKYAPTTKMVEMINALEATIEKHENEIDIPLFRLIVKKRDELSL